MKLNVCVVLGDDRQWIKIAVGAGDKSFKWLGLIAAQRFALGQPRGSRRRRETRGQTAANSTFMPIQVATEDCSFYHPDESINQYLGDNDEVEVTLAPKVPINQVGAPQLSRWALIAFVCSEANSELKEEALRLEYHVQKETLRIATEEEAERTAAIQESKAAGIREIMKTQLHDESKVEEAADEDWYVLLHSRYIEDTVKGAMDQRELRRDLQKNYVPLTEMFKTYGASSSAVGTAHELEFTEFRSMVHDLELFGGSGSGETKGLHDMLHKIFSRCHCPSSAINTKGMSQPQLVQVPLDRCGYFNTLIYLGVVKYIQGFGEKKPAEHHSQRLSTIGGQSGEAQLSSGGNHTILHPDVSIGQAFFKLLHEDVLPFTAKLMIGSVVKHAISTKEVLSLFHDHKEQLYSIYHTYSPRASPADINECDFAEGYMTLNDFGTLVDHSKMIGKTRSDGLDDLTLKEVRQAFAAAQMEPLFGDDGHEHDVKLTPEAQRKDTKAADEEVKSTNTGQPVSNLNHLQLMSFAEFLESIARLAMLKWESEDEQNYSKVERACLMICENSEDGIAGKYEESKAYVKPKAGQVKECGNRYGDGW